MATAGRQPPFPESTCVVVGFACEIRPRRARSACPGGCPAAMRDCCSPPPIMTLRLHQIDPRPSQMLQFQEDHHFIARDLGCRHRRESDTIRCAGRCMRQQMAENTSSLPNPSSSNRGHDSGSAAFCWGVRSTVSEPSAAAIGGRQHSPGRLRNQLQCQWKRLIRNAIASSR